MPGLFKNYQNFIKILVRFILQAFSLLSELFVRPNKCRIPMLDDPILLLPAVKLSEQIKSRKLTCEQVVEAYIRRIRIVNPILNAVIDQQFDKALKRAQDLDDILAQQKSSDAVLAQMPLFGVPLTIKESIGLLGSSFTGGLPSRASIKASRNSPCVDRLMKAGAIPIGSTNTPCMNLWWDTNNVLYGQTNNPYDLSRTPGGSTGGEAAIISSAGSVIGIGSDLGGSIRIPSNFCGIFGHLASSSAITLDGVYPIFRKERAGMLCLGPMTRYAIDLMPMLKAMCDESAVNKLRLDEPVDLSKLKFYYCEDLGDHSVTPCSGEIISGLRNAVDHFKLKFNVETKKVMLGEFKYGLFMWNAEFDGGRIPNTEHPDGYTPFEPISEIFRYLIGRSEFTFNAIICTMMHEYFNSKLGSENHNILSRKAEELRAKFNELMGDNGVLLMPSHPEPAPTHQSTTFKLANVSWTAMGNVLHAPVTQCPLGMSKEGLPFGLQVLAKPFNDRLTIAVANELEKVFGGWYPPMKISVSN